MNTLFTFSAVLGIAAITAFSIAARTEAASRFLAFCKQSTAAAAVANLWCLALIFRWWTVAIFLGVSLATGLACVYWQRRAGKGALASAATAVGALIPLSGVLSIGYVAALTPTPEWFVWCPVC